MGINEDTTRVVDLLPILFERFNAFQTLWNLDIVVSLGIIGVFAQSKRLNSNLLITLALLVGYAGFAWSNYDALRVVLKQRLELEIGIVSELPRDKAEYLDHLKELCLAKPAFAQGQANIGAVAAGSRIPDRCPLSPTSLEGLNILHFFADLIVSALIITLYIKRDLNPAKPGPAA